MDAGSRQTSTTHRPHLLRLARVSDRLPGFFIRGVDELRDGRGAMRMAVLGLFTVVDASGPDMIRARRCATCRKSCGSRRRARKNIAWEAVDLDSARATLTVGTARSTGCSRSQATGASWASRRCAIAPSNRRSVLRTWRVPLRDHAAFDGVLVPTSGRPLDLDDGTFTYITAKIVELDYDVPQIFGR